jgi:hypothetical protein
MGNDMVSFQRDKDTLIIAERKHTLSEQEAARFLGLRSHQTLYLWRKKGVGPPFVCYQDRLIRYRLRDLLRWQRRQLVVQSGSR